MSGITRRAFLITGAAVGTAAVGGMVVGVGYLSTVDTEGLDGWSEADRTVHLNAWVRIAKDGTITFAVPRTEMGQGVFTALPMLVAEELEVDLDAANVRVEHPVEELAVYTNYALGLEKRPEDLAGPIGWLGKKVMATFPVIATGGSTSVVNAWRPLRIAGASARLMLIEAAAERWGVLASDCYAEDGHVLHRLSDRRLAYAELAEAAAGKMPVADPPLKPASAFKLIGKARPRLDIPAKVRGAADFGIDVTLPGMLYAAIRQNPIFGSTVTSIDASAVAGMPGVVEVADLGDAVAVIADRYWNADQALQALPVTYDTKGHEALSSETFRAEMLAALDRGDANTFRDEGDVEGVLEQANSLVEATYETPLLAHACMEPMNCTALYRDGSVELWVSTQSPLVSRFAAERAADVSGSVKTHVTLTGGGFGRRADADMVEQATALAARVPGRPVKLIWSREEDIQHDMYRPHAVSRFRAALGADGLPLAWHNRVVSQSLRNSYGGRNLPVAAGGGNKDTFSIEGAHDLDYAIPNIRAELVDYETPVPIGFWRSVGHSNSAFFKESFVDECAQAAGQDPLDYRRRLLAGHPRHLRVLETLAEKSGWGRALGPGRGQGVAFHPSFRSFVAQAAEVTVTAEGKVSVDRVVCVVDCGTVVNPDTVRAQMESGIIYGLTAALFGEITIEEGRVAQSNFHDYDMVRLAEAPEIEVHIIENDELPGGVGEPGVPPIAPAVTNAIFAASGERVRALPLTKAGFTAA